MTKIIYFGTEGNGKAGHYPIGVDKGLTHEECKIWSECDNQVWIDNICKKSRSSFDKTPWHRIY